MIIQSEYYKQFEKDCGYFLNKYRGLKIDYPVNIKCIFYFGDRKRRDLTNLENAIADILVKYEILADDNYTIINSWDGSTAIYEKGKNEIMLEITKKE